MITLQNLTIAHSDKPLIASVNTTFKAATMTVLVGRNGAGKSSLLRVIAGLDSPKGGEVLIGGKALGKLTPQQRAAQISFVNTQRVRVANLLCRDVVAIGRAPYTNWMGKLQQQDIDAVTAALEAVGMADFATRPINTLSDGEAQRVMIARALAQQTPIIVLDEPTAFLDIPTRFEICQLLASLAHTAGKTILFSTHDIDSSIPVADCVAIVENGDLQLLQAPKAKQAIEALFAL